MKRVWSQRNLFVDWLFVCRLCVIGIIVYFFLLWKRRFVLKTYMCKFVNIKVCQVCRVQLKGGQVFVWIKIFIRNIYLVFCVKYCVEYFYFKFYLIFMVIFRQVCVGVIRYFFWGLWLCQFFQVSRRRRMIQEDLCLLVMFGILQV